MDSVVSFLQSTMIIERLFGVGTYVLLLGYYFNKIQNATNTKWIDKYLNHYLIILCVLAFFYIPGQSADLSRWREMAEPWENVGFGWFWEHRVLTSTVPVGYLLVYLCQITGINGILPMVCALGFFGNVFHMIKCEAKRENVNADSVALTLLLVMASGVFLEVISGVRCMLAFSIVVRCAYDEMRGGKKFLLHIPFYVLAVLLHTAAIPLVGIRLVCMLFEKKRSPILIFINASFVLVSILIALRIGSDYIDAAFEKAGVYTSHNVYSYTWEYIIAAIGILLILSIVYKLKRCYPNEWLETKSSGRYLILILAYTLIFFNTYSIFQRFFSASLISTIPIAMTLFSCENQNGRWKMRRRAVLTLLVILLLACTRGNLCGYKFFYLW